MHKIETKVLEFDLARKEIPCKLGGVEWVLREMDGTMRDQYLNAISSRVRMVDGKANGVKDFGGLQALLLTRSLYRKDDNQPATQAEIQAWPSSVVGALFDRAKELSGLGDEEGEEEGES